MAAAAVSARELETPYIEPWESSSKMVVPILYQVCNAVPESGVVVDWDPDACVRKPGTREHETAIKATWDARRVANPRLFNGTKFRLADWSLDDPSKPCLRLGLTSYRAFQGTNASSHALELMRHGAVTHGDYRSCMGNALGIGMTVVTTDGDVLFIRRSHHVGEAKGLVDVVGGHAEPSAVGLAPDRWDHSDTPAAGWEVAPRLRALDGSADASGHPSPVQAARRELFVSPLDETDEELNVPRAALGAPLLLGLAANATTGGRVSTAYAGETLQAEPHQLHAGLSRDAVLLSERRAAAAC